MVQLHTFTHDNKQNTFKYEYYHDNNTVDGATARTGARTAE